MLESYLTGVAEAERSYRRSERVATAVFMLSW